MHVGEKVCWRKSLSNRGFAFTQNMPYVIFANILRQHLFKFFYSSTYRKFLTNILIPPTSLQPWIGMDFKVVTNIDPTAKSFSLKLLLMAEIKIVKSGFP